MTGNNLSQRTSGVSKHIEILRSESMSHPDNGGRDTWRALGQSGRANYLSREGGGHERCRAESFFGEYAGLQQRGASVMQSDSPES